MSIKYKIFVSVLVGNYLLTLYTFLVYGVQTNNILFTICNTSILLFTFINVIIYLFVKYYNVVKVLIK